MTDKQPEAPANLAFDDVVNSLIEDIDDNLMVQDNKQSKAEAPKEVEQDPQVDDDEEILAELDDETEADDDTPEEASDTEQDDSNDGETDQEVLFEIDGESITRTEAEKGYLRQSDYTKKTQELAEQRKALDEEAKTLAYLQVQRDLQPQAVAIHKTQENINQAVQDITNGYRDVDGELVQLSHAEIEQLKSQVTEAEQFVRYETAKIQKEMAQTPPPKLDELKEKVPALFSDKEEERKPVLDTFHDVLADVGFSQVEIASVNDPRLLLLVKELVDGRELAARVAKAKARKGKGPGVVSKSTKSSKRTTQSSNRKATDPNKSKKIKEEIANGDMTNIADFIGEVI